MATRLSDTSESSSDEENVADYGKIKRISDYSFDNDSDKRSSKKTRFDSEYIKKEGYYNTKIQEDVKEDQSFQTSSMNNFYDRNYSDDKSDNDADENPQSSYYHDYNLSDYTDNISKSKIDDDNENICNVNFGNTKSKNKSFESGSNAKEKMEQWDFDRGLDVDRSSQDSSGSESTASNKKQKINIDFESAEMEDELSFKSSSKDEKMEQWDFNKGLGFHRSTQDSSVSENTVTKKQKVNRELEIDEKEKTSSFKNASKVEKMMKRWGYKEGLGLGRNLQGRSEPVSASTQKGRRGLGLELQELDEAHMDFKPEEEIVTVKEDISWLKNEYESLPTNEEIIKWEKERKIGARQDTIDGETIFSNEIIVKNVVKAKSVFEKLDKNEMREARTRSNPFETIRGSIFLNRAAVKMANIDRVCNYMFTKPIHLKPNELLYFADVCAGPGGFSEYVLWRKKWHAKGFGFTLKNENDFKLHDFHAGPCETFHPYYGPKNNGDVYDPENQVAFRDLIMRETEGQGVHFMMSDGGFSVEGQENIQEILSKQLYLCQCLVALMIVRTSGHFVTKLFDLFTPFSAGLVYIMYRCFEKISIFKPNTSRPANSERYLICQGKLPDIDHIIDYLFKTNKKLLKYNKTNDILELVPVEKLTSETEFFEYLKESNEVLGQRQIVGLKKIAAYTQDKSLLEIRQKLMREDCLKYWELPDEARTIPRHMNPADKAQSLLQNSFSVLKNGSYKNATVLTKENSNTHIWNKYDWFCMPCSSGKEVLSMGVEDKAPTFYLGMGRSQVFKYYFDKGHWESVKSSNSTANLIIELPRDTLVYAELVTEFRKEERSQSKTYGLHILDAFVLGAENISTKYLEERYSLIQLFCKALWKPVHNTLVPVRVKELFPVNEKLDEKIVLKTKIMKNNMKVLGYFPHKYFYENDNNEPYYYIPRSVIFFKAIDKPWACHFSKKYKKLYYYHMNKQIPSWEIPDDAIVNFSKTIQNRLLWNWPSDQSFTMNEFIGSLKP